MFKVKLYDTEYEIELKKSKYINNDALAVIAIEEDGCPFGNVTVNLDASNDLPEDCAFVDENNWPGVGKFLVENEIARPTPIWEQSGYCMYQAFKFYLDKIEEV